VATVVFDLPITFYLPFSTGVPSQIARYSTKVRGTYELEEIQALPDSFLGRRTRSNTVKQGAWISPPSGCRIYIRCKTISTFSSRDDS
jgi:hypothetical protein